MSISSELTERYKEGTIRHSTFGTSSSHLIPEDLHSYAILRYLSIHRFSPSSKWWCKAQFEQMNTPNSWAECFILSRETQSGLFAGQSAHLWLSRSCSKAAILLFNSGEGGSLFVSIVMVYYFMLWYCWEICCLTYCWRRNFLPFYPYSEGWRRLFYLLSMGLCGR